MSLKLLRVSLLPLLVFPTLSALAFTLIFGRLKSTRLDKALTAQCSPASMSTYFLPYTGPVEQAFCPIVAFFHLLIDFPDSLAFLTYTIGITGPLILLPIVESFQAGQNTLLAYPVLWGLLTQGATLGVTFPIYWLVFVLAANKKDGFGGRSLTQAQAEAIIFSIIVGAAIPSVAMLIMDDFYVTALWQPYPIYISFARFVYLQFRSSSTATQSGYRVMQAIYLGCFMISSSVHIAAVWPILKDVNAVKALLIPSFAPLPISKEVHFHVLEFLKWDVLFAYSSSALAMLWFANNAKQVFGIVLWFIFAIPLLGFGATVMGIAIWKDGMLD
ncbi:hypothetical protein M413DRAFT_438494 [Hebeloma cylindrosporum]|uniref:Uncharacterized protein n=1 Tax=Hebeloma cylindrosporum TaxID=76867 RepID=A0A0C2YHP4_HEBCY|nr:hypothetical protein M413DRAFT_438494 [Hebeloma cylindrosporum h7]